MDENIKWLIAKAVIGALFIGSMIYAGVTDSMFTIATTMVVVILVFAFMKLKYPERYMHDERTRRIGAYAASWSWTLTFVAVALLYWFDCLGITGMPASAVLGILLFFMVATMLLSRWHISRKSELLERA